MKQSLMIIATVAAITAAYAAQAQVECTTYPNGQIICVPIGGGSSNYR